MAKSRKSDDNSSETKDLDSQTTDESAANQDLPQPDPDPNSASELSADSDTSSPSSESDDPVAEAEDVTTDPQDPSDDQDTPEMADPSDPEGDRSNVDRDSLDAALGTAALVASGAAPDPVEEPEAEVDLDDHHPDDADHEPHEQEHRSLASRVLTWLVLLLAGGGLALWGAPRIAPNLPDGLGPVKAWLLPGEMQSRQAIADLESRIDARLNALSPELDTDAVAGVVDARIAETDRDIEQRIAALADQVAGSDSAEIEARIGAIETRLSGLASQLDS